MIIVFFFGWKWTTEGSELLLVSVLYWVLLIGPLHFPYQKEKIHGNQLGLLGHGILLHLRKLLVGWKVFSFSVLKIGRATLYILYSCLAGYITNQTCEQHRATLSQSHLLLLLPPMHALLDMSFSVYLHFHNFKLGLCNGFYVIKRTQFVIAYICCHEYRDHIVSWQER